MNLFFAMLLLVAASIDAVTLLTTKVLLPKAVIVVFLSRVFCCSYAGVYLLRVWSMR